LESVRVMIVMWVGFGLAHVNARAGGVGLLPHRDNAASTTLLDPCDFVDVWYRFQSLFLPNPCSVTCPYWAETEVSKNNSLLLIRRGEQGGHN
jgi:hypothetical protein